MRANSMNRRSAHILSTGKAEIRAIGESCDPSCMMWFCCANSVPNGTCKGFLLLDGESRKLLQRNMQEDALLYLEDCVGAVQNGCSPEAKRSLTKEVYRCLKPVSDVLKKEPIERRGFRGMLDKVSPSKPEQSISKPVIRGFGRGFSGMLDELSGGKKRSIAGVRPREGIDKCTFDCNFHELCENFEYGELCKGFKPKQTAPEETRGFRDGFIGMLEDASRGSSVVTRSQPQKPILLGFGAMIDTLNGENEEEEEIVHASTFRGVLADVNRQSEQESEEKRLKGHHRGFRGVLDSISEGIERRSASTSTPDPVLRKLQRELRAIRNGM